MKRTFVCRFIVSILLMALVFCLSGCKGGFSCLEGWQEYTAKSGETAAEGHRRHLRNLSVNQQSLVGDLDRALLTDEPIKATKIKIP